MASELTPEAIAELRRLNEERLKFRDWPSARSASTSAEWMNAAAEKFPALLDAAERCAAAEALADKLASGVKMTCAAPVCDLCGWRGDWVPTLKEASDVVKAHMHHCDEVQKMVDAKAEAQAKAAGELLRGLLEACEAKDSLLACYRLGKRPSEALFKKLDKAKEAIEAAERAGVKP